MTNQPSDRETQRLLTEWFTERLDQINIHIEEEPVSYDGNSAYDIVFYQLQAEAASHWQLRYGFVPTPGQLMNGFFGAEFERFRRKRLAARPTLTRLGDWMRRALHRPPRGPKSGRLFG